MNILIAILNLAFLAFMLFYLGLMAFSLLSTRYRLRKTAKEIRRMNLVSRKLTADEAAACKKIYPRFANRINTGDSVVTIIGHYGYTKISGRYSVESRMQHAIGPLPFYFLQCMESSLSEEEENTAELILLSSGTVIPVSINDAWTVQTEAAARDALDKGHFSAAGSAGSKLSDRNESPSVREYQTYHPPLRILATCILLTGIILMLAWNRELPEILLYAGAALAATASLWIIFPGSGRAAKKTSRVTLSGAVVIRGSVIMVDRFVLQVLPKGCEVLEEGKKIRIEGWVHPKNQVTFYTTAIRDSYGEILWSLEKNHGSRAWMRFLLPLIITVLSLFMYSGVNYSWSTAKDYLNWKAHGQTVQTVESIAQLAEKIEKPGAIPPGALLNFDNVAIVEDLARTRTSYTYRIIEKTSHTLDFSKTRNRAAMLSELIRVPLCTSLFVATHYAQNQLRYIAMHIDQFTSDASPHDFAHNFPDSLHYRTFLDAYKEMESGGMLSIPEVILHSWNAFLEEEITNINDSIANELTRTVFQQHSVLIQTDYNRPTASYSLPGDYLKESDLNPYKIPQQRNPTFGRTTLRESWIAETPRYQEKLNELEERFTSFPYKAEDTQTALVTGTGTTPDGEPILELTFSLYRVERAQKEAEKLMILLALVAVSVIFTAAMSGYILRDVIKNKRVSKN